MPHIHQKIDFTVEVFIVFKNKVLLRQHDKYRIWLGVGGHIELDEDPNQAAIREVKEEVGLDIILDDSLQFFQKDNVNYKELIPPYFLNIHRINNTHQHITLTYFAKSKNDRIKQMMEREKSSECKWFSRNELNNQNVIHEDVKFYASKALEVLAK